MVTLELTKPEADLLQEIALEWLSDLRLEIGGTDDLSYREALKWKESLLRDILDHLGAPVPAFSS